MKNLITIFLVLCSVFANAQLKGTDTAHFVSNTSHKQFWASPYGVHKIFAMHNVGFRPGSWPVYATLPNGILTGELVWVEDSVRYAYWNGSVWNLMTPDGLGGVAGVSTFNTRSGAVTLQASDVSGVGGFLNGLNAFGANSTIGNSDNFALSIRTNNTERIGITNAGAVSIPAGTFAVGGTGNGTVNIQNSSASTRGSIDLTSNNPRLNSATGTWVFAQSGNTVGLYNGTGFFFGGGTAPSGFVVGILAGTTTNAPLRLNSGPLTTTPVAGNIEFLTDKFYGTITTGPARKEFTLNDAALTSGRIPFATTNGRLLDDAGLSWDNSTKVFQLGGTSSSFPGLLRDGASIQVKLADNSANANLKVLNQAYSESTWDNNDEVPTKNAIRDLTEGSMTQTLWRDFTINTTSGTSESDLYTYTTPANTLSADGQYLEYEISGVLDPTNNNGGINKTLRVYWAGTEVHEQSSTFSNFSAYTARVRVVRVSSANVRIFITWTHGAMGSGSSQTVLHMTNDFATTFSGTNIIKVTGQSANASEQMDVRYGVLRKTP
jgi:hypothetical protein